MYRSVLNWLDETVKQYSDKTVFSDSENSISYAEFNNFTKAVGTFLTSVIRPENPVIVMTGRHVFTPACYLGVVRAGCFYAPADATMPVLRLNQILNVIRASLMIVDRQNLEIAKKLDFDGKILIMEDIIHTIPDDEALKTAENTLHEFSPLYVLFTSGSTGTPKGVVTSHNALMCYIDAVKNVLRIQEKDVLGNQSPLDYVAAIRDIYLPIRTGASTVIIPKNEFAMPEQLFNTLDGMRVTTLCWSAAGLELLAKLNAFARRKPSYVKKVCFSGSVLQGKYLKVWKENLPDAMFVNQYGPTEATASCTYYVVSGNVTDDTVLPIGKPYENYQVFLLNEEGEAVKDGEIGEICIGGPGLSLGYYGNSQKTVESFIQNPLNPNYRELIYKTGDLGKYNTEGLLEFHGRKDRQIKHLGHRIELDEIEGTAKALSGVSGCCALYDGKNECLYLFYVGSVLSQEIVLYLRNTLPGFMVPRKVIRLDSMPALPNGKTDMQALKSYFK